MSSSGHKRIIRREEGDTPRTQSEYFPSDDIGDAFFSDEAPGAVTHAVAPQQHVDENAEIMQQFRLDGRRLAHHIQGSVVSADFSTCLQQAQVSKALSLIGASGDELSSLQFLGVYARFDSTLDASSFHDLAPYLTRYSANGRQAYLRVPIQVGYDDGRSDELFVFECKLYNEQDGGKLVLHFMNVPCDHLVIVCAAIRRVIRRMKRSLPPNQRLQYELPKFQGKHVYRLPAKLCCDDVDDLVSACQSSDALKDLRVEVQTKKRSPQLLMMYARDASFNIQVTGRSLIVCEWFDMSAAAAGPSPRHVPAKDALVRFSALRSNLKRHSAIASASAGGGCAGSAAAFVVPGPGCGGDMASAPCQTHQQFPLPLPDNQPDADDMHLLAGDSESEADLGVAGPLYDDWVEDGDPCFEDIGVFPTQDRLSGWGARGA